MKGVHQWLCKYVCAGIILVQRGKYLIVDDCFRIIKYKLPIITVNEAQECHQSDSDLGLDWSKLWQGYLVIPVNFR